MQRVLIAGCGYVGVALGLELAAQGYEVWGLRRGARALPEPIRAVEADLCDVAALELALPDAIDLCVYCAGADGGDEGAYRAAYVDGVRNALTVVRARGARRLIFTSSTGVFGQEDGSWIDESSPAEPASPVQRLLLEGEALVTRSGLEGIVLRLAGIYGPGRDRLVRSVRCGTALRPREPVYLNRIHRDDAAGFLAYLLHLDAPQRTYIGADDEPVDRGECLAWIARELGLPPPPFESEPPRSHNKRCSNARLRSSGYRLRYPTFREGYRALL